MSKTTSVRTYHMVEIAGLAASMAALIVEKQIESVPISPELFRHLVHAAQILSDNGVPWPHSVQVVVAEVGKRVVGAEARHSANEEQHGCGHRKAE